MFSEARPNCHQRLQKKDKNCVRQGAFSGGLVFSMATLSALADTATILCASGADDISSA
jgi:hypothetical protein